MFNKFVTFISMLLFFISCSLYASPSEEWGAYKKLLIAQCIAVSNLDNPKPAGDIILYDDNVGFDALLILGDNPQYQQNKHAGSELCLFDKGKHTAHVADASYLIKPNKS